MIEIGSQKQLFLDDYLSVEGFEDSIGKSLIGFLIALKRYNLSV